MTVGDRPARRLDELLSGGTPMGASAPERVCAACVRALPVTGAAVAVTSGTGHRGTVCATDETVSQIEELQFTLGEGPGIDAFATNTPVLVADLTDVNDPAAARWAAFTPAATAAGVRGVYALPLALGVVALGSLDLYCQSPATLRGADLTEAMLLADAAAVALLDLRAAQDGERADGHVDSALDGSPYHRAEVHQATGMVMVQLAVGAEDALIRLRGHAFAHEQSIDAVARDIIGLRLRLDPDRR
jgi:hypothetical protein